MRNWSIQNIQENYDVFQKINNINEDYVMSIKGLYDPKVEEYNKIKMYYSIEKVLQRYAYTGIPSLLSSEEMNTIIDAYSNFYNDRTTNLMLKQQNILLAYYLKLCYLLSIYR